MITQRRFGTDPLGQAVTLFTLTAGDYSADIITYGATLVAFRTPDRAGRINDIVLGFDTLDGYLPKNQYIGKTVGRFANRIAEGTFTIDGETFHARKNEPTAVLHGGEEGISNYTWHAETYEADGAPGVMLSHVSKDGASGFPGKCTVSVSYLLQDDGALFIDYDASSSKPTPISLTNHSYFNLAGAASGSILNHVLRISCNRYLQVDANLIPHESPASVEGTAFDFRSGKPIGRDMGGTGIAGYDHCLVMEEKEADGLREFAHVVEPTSGRTLTCYTTLPAVQFYTANHLDGTIKGKGGLAYGRHAGFCLETQEYPDAPNHPDYPDCILRPGTVWRHTTVYDAGVI
ncbi:aldose epimerase family protein [Parasphaerochaeta coccoides]|nr:aldose epimerase family protein [Parasphaerochaeta coccoides]